MPQIDASEADRTRSTPRTQPLARPVSPNASVIVVVLDDAGTEWFDWHDVGEKYTTDPAFRYARTPFLSQLAREDGIWFSMASVEFVCSPTRVSLQSGLLPNRTGVAIVMRDPNTPAGPADPTYKAYGFAPPEDLPYLASRIGAQRPNVARAAFGKWHMCDGYSGQVPGSPPVAPPTFVKLPEKCSYPSASGCCRLTSGGANVGGAYSWWKVVDGVPSFVAATNDETSYPTSVHAAAAAQWLAQRTGPFFAYVAFGPPHSEFTVPPYTMLSGETTDELAAAGLPAGFVFPRNVSYATRGFGQPTFGAMVEATDEGLRRVWDAVPEHLRDETTLIVIGDNGTVQNGLPPGFVHSKRTLYWGGTRVPLLVRGPRVRNPGRECRQIVHAVDVHRTVCELLGVAIAPDESLDAVSFLPVMEDRVDRFDVNALRKAVVMQVFQPLGQTNPPDWTLGSRARAAFDGRWRIIAGTNEEGEPLAPTLYHEPTDPLEIADVADQFPDEVVRMRTLLDDVVPE